MVLQNNYGYAQSKTCVYAWSDYANGQFGNRIIKTCRVGIQPKYSYDGTYSITQNIDQIDSVLKRMPQGHRIIQIWLPPPYLSILINNGADRLKDTIYRRILEQNLGCNIFWDEGAKQLGSIFDLFFKELKGKGAQVDYIMLDMEDNVSNWRVNSFIERRYEKRNGGDTVGERKDIDQTFDIILQSIKNRYGNLPTKLERINPNAIFDGIYDPVSSYIFFNSFFEDQFCHYLDIAFYNPAKKYFPEVRCSNYGAFFKDSSYQIPDSYGHKIYLGGDGCIPGTNQSPSFYGFLSPSIIKFLPSKNKGQNFKNGITPFDALLYEINLFKSLLINKTAAISPYIASRSFSGYGYLIEGNDYYQENLFHILLGGCRNILLWNGSCSTCYDDERLVNNCVSQVDSLLQFTPFSERKPVIQNDSIYWDRNYVLSRIDIPAGSLWRLTPNWKLLGGIPSTFISFLQDAKRVIISQSPLTFLIGSQKIIFPTTSRIIYPSPLLSLGGFWVWAPKSESKRN